MDTLLPRTAHVPNHSVNNNGITGEGAEQLAKVVLEHGSLVDFGGIPLSSLREDSISELDLQRKGVGVPGALVLSKLLPTATKLSSLKCDSEARIPTSPNRTTVSIFETVHLVSSLGQLILLPFAALPTTTSAKTTQWKGCSPSARCSRPTTPLRS